MEIFMFIKGLKRFKGTVKVCLIKYALDITVYNLKKDPFQLWVLYCRKQQRFINTLNLEKLQCLPLYLSDKGFMGTVVNLALKSMHGGSLEITLTVLLRKLFSFVAA